MLSIWFLSKVLTNYQSESPIYATISRSTISLLQDVCLSESDDVTDEILYNVRRYIPA